MFTRISAAVVAMLIVIVTTAPLPAFAIDEKTPEECQKFLDEMTNDLDTLQALVPNVPPEEASYIDKEYAAAIKSGAGKRIYEIENRPRFPAWNLQIAFDDAREALKAPRAAVLDLKFKIQMASRIPYRMANAKIA